MRQSAASPIDCSVPLESLLGYLSFSACTGDVVDLLDRHDVKSYPCADDSRGYMPAAGVTTWIILRTCLSHCSADVAQWCTSRRLQPTEVTWFGSRNSRVIHGIQVAVSGRYPLGYSDPTWSAVHYRRSRVSDGTVCRLTLPQLQRWLFFGTSSKLTSFPDHFLPNCFRFPVLYTVYSSDLA